MGWGRKDLQASSVGSGPFTADYNRNYDTHTAHSSSREFAVNPPDIADVGPYEYSGIGPDKQERAYRNPSNRAPAVEAHDSQYGYLGDTVGPREIQTGNAPSGGYSTRPGLGFSANQPGVVGANPDRRRINPTNRADDWEENQYAIHENRDAELRYRRSMNTSENFVEFDQLPQAGTPNGLSAPVNAIEDSPYRKDWSDNHSDMGPGSATHNTNPNRFRNYDLFDKDSSYRSRTRYMNGTHYSMAEHKSLNPYINQANGGSSVQQVKRNTYYMTPQPWDTTSTDGPSNVAGYDTVTTLAGGNFSSSYRL